MTIQPHESPKDKDKDKNFHKDFYLVSAIQSLAQVRSSLRLVGQLDDKLLNQLEELHREILKRLDP